MTKNWMSFGANYQKGAEYGDMGAQAQVRFQDFEKGTADLR